MINYPCPVALAHQCSAALNNRIIHYRWHETYSIHTSMCRCVTSWTYIYFGVKVDLFCDLLLYAAYCYQSLYWINKCSIEKFVRDVIHVFRPFRSWKSQYMAVVMRSKDLLPVDGLGYACLADMCYRERPCMHVNRDSSAFDRLQESSLYRQLYVSYFGKKGFYVYVRAELGGWNNNTYFMITFCDYNFFFTKWMLTRTIWCGYI